MNFAGAGTSAITWGFPQTAAGKSGYTFASAATPVTLTSGTDFALGTFTHRNNPIDASPDRFTGATLQLSYDFLIDGSNYSLTRDYRFSHWETPNESSICADGGTRGTGVNVNGCADRVQITSNPAGAETVTIGGVRYTFNITGFAGLDNEGGIPTFWTKEAANNKAGLSGVFEEYIEPAPVPLPASGMLLLGGLAGLAALRRRKSV